MHLSNLSSLSASCGLTHTYSLPLLSPLPDISAPLFVKLDPVTFLVISATWKGGGGGGGVEESYFLLRVSPATYLPLVTDENIPRSFFKLETLIRINPAEAFDHMSGIVTSELTTPIVVTPPLTIVYFSVSRFFEIKA